MATWSIVLIVVAAVLLAALIALVIIGNRMQKKQEAAEANIMNGAQTVSMLIIDKKKMKITEAGFPDIVVQQTPWYLKHSKVPVVKAKVGPQVHSLMCDAKIFDNVPVKKEVKAVVNGMYIIKVMGLRGPLEAPQEKKGFFKRLLNKAQKETEAAKKKK
ncbi:MAG: hypothetical protein K6G60_07910 [Lachnospiraceae bacterium]|nr:hypothetical protein [Lachnospiraceae bacterium]